PFREQQRLEHHHRRPGRPPALRIRTILGQAQDGANDLLPRHRLIEPREKFRGARSAEILEHHVHKGLLLVRSHCHDRISCVANRYDRLTEVVAPSCSEFPSWLAEFFRDSVMKQKTYALCRPMPSPAPVPPWFARRAP